MSGAGRSLARGFVTVVVVGLVGCAAEPTPETSIVTSAPATEPAPAPAPAADAVDAPPSTPPPGAGPAPGAPAVPPASPAVVAKRVFVTSAAYSGDLKTAGGGADGFAGADNLCGQHAAAVGLGGTFRAYLSGRHAGLVLSASARVGGPGPWMLADGRIVFGDAAEIVLAPRLPVAVTETGESVIGPVWTGSRAGLSSGDACDDGAGESWSTGASSSSATTGRSDVTEAWSDAGTASCAAPARLFCFEL